jgi:predicted RNA-binding protein with PIN domain
MSLRYIIDGYNVIRHPSFSFPKKIKDGRLALVEFIRTNCLCGSPKNKIVIVFDGNPNVSGRDKINTEVNVVFTKNETADEHIKRLIESEDNPKNTVVVSDDKEIKFFVKSVGGVSMGVEEFINHKEKLNQARSKDAEALALKPELNYSQIHKINQELKKIWLK